MGLSYHIIMKYKFNCIGSLLFLRIYHLGVNLSGLDICMAKHLADGKKVCTLSKLVRGVRMSEAMEGYLFLMPAASTHLLTGLFIHDGA